MSIVENPSKRLCERVSGIDFAADKLHLDVEISFPILNCKIGNIDVSRSFRRDTGIYYFDGRVVVFVQRSWIVLWEAQVSKYRPEV